MSDAALATPAAVQQDDKITCHLDGAKVHSIAIHLKNVHPSVTIEEYRAKFPGAPTMSKSFEAKVRKQAAEKAAAAAVVKLESELGMSKQPMHEIFGLARGGSIPAAAKNARGAPIMVTAFEPTGEAAEYIPAVDDKYVFDIELVKTALFALEMNIPSLFWGYHGTGKTTLVEQIHARTKRGLLRVQHTVNTEEAHITGQWTVKGGETVFQPGPLVLAMMLGLTYLADEYDFAMPSVTSVYQPVLEGKALVIKDASPEFRIIKPHPQFRFVATGNTNGVGDETGLYQGTQLQNAANYSRFGITEQVGYMTADVEKLVVAQQAMIDPEDAAKLVKFAKDVRDSFAAGRIGSTVSPRELINAGRIAAGRGGDWRKGLQQALTNRMGKVDKETVEGFAQRIFG